jgi:hypothetical protein
VILHPALASHNHLQQTTMVTDMSNRDLFRAAVLAWATAAVVAVVFGLPVLVMVGGVHIDVGLTVNALAVIGSVGAASVALWIATRDRQDRERVREDYRHEREQEADQADEVQAGLVILERTQPGIRVAVENYGKFPVLDVTFVKLDVEEHADARLQPKRDVLSVVPPRSEDHRPYSFEFVATDTATQIALEGEWNSGRSARVSNATINRGTNMTATVRFRDAKGIRWKTTFQLFNEIEPGSGLVIPYTRRLSLTRL